MPRTARHWSTDPDLESIWHFQSWPFWVETEITLGILTMLRHMKEPTKAYVLSKGFTPKITFTMFLYKENDDQD